MTRSIGGNLGMLELAALAGVHDRRQLGPPDQAHAAAAARDLRAQGLTVADIAQALRIGEAAVRQLLEVPDAQA